MSLADHVGKTPLVRLPTGVDNPRVRLYGKLEGLNPGGSVKDRAALSMISRAEERGDLNRDITLIEPTSGNTGIALAMIAAAKGYRIQLVMPESATLERVRAMEHYGAEVVLTPERFFMEGAIDHARDKVARGGFLMLDQFSNPDNWRAHYENTGPEIWEATDGKITHFVSAMGTTGTIMGTSRFLKEQRADVQIIGCQPADEAQIPGIRRWPKEYLPAIFEPERVDATEDVTTAEAVSTARDVAHRAAVFGGMSSGAAVHVARRVCGRLEEGVVVCVICDRGDRYLSSNLFT